MSTKSTIKYGPHYHLYDEYSDGFVWFEWEGEKLIFSIRLTQSKKFHAFMRALKRVWLKVTNPRAVKQRDEASGEGAGETPNSLRTED